MAENYKVTAVLSADDKNMSSTFGKISKLGATTFGAFASLGADAMRAVTGGVSGFAKSVVSLGTGFTAQMSEVGAISGATGQDLQALEDTARSLGATTQFSATEAAEGLKYMAMAGWETEDMIAGLPGVLDLAAASGENLGTVSDIVTDAMTAFGLEAEQAGHFADVLAMASSKSNTNVSMLGESFKYVAPVAGAMGYKVEDTAVALGLMANSGIKASAAGTALRTLLTNMAKPTDTMAAAMDELGISLTDGEGNMKSMQKVMDNLREGFSGLTEEQQAEYAASIAGKEGMSGLLAIVNASADDYDKLTEAINGCDGAASQMAATMNDNLQGDLRQLNSAWEELQLQLFDYVEPAMRSVVQFVTSNVIPAISDLISYLKGMDFSWFQKIDWKPLLGIVGAAGTAIAAIKGFGFLKSFNPFSSFGKKGKSTFAQLGTGLGNLIGNSAKGMGMMVKNVEVGFGQMSKSIMTGFGQMTKAIGTMPLTGVVAFAGVVGVLTAAFLALAACKDIVLPFLQGLGDILVSLIDGALQAVANCLVTLAPIMVTMAEALSALSPLVVAVGEAFAAAAPFVEAMGVAIGSVVTAIGGAAAQIATALAPIVEIVGGVFTQCVAIVSDAVVRIVEALAPYIPEITRLAEVTGEVIDRICTTFDTLLSNISPIIDSITNLVSQLGDTISEVFHSIGDVIESVGNAISGVLNSIAGIIDSIGNAAFNAGLGFEAMARGIKTITELNAWDMAGSLAAVAAGLGGIAASAGGLSTAASSMQTLSAAMAESGQGAMVAFASIAALVGIIPSISGVASGAASGFSSAFRTIQQTASSSMEAVSSTVKSSGTAMVSSVMSVTNQINSAFKSGFSKIGPTTASAMASMASGISSGGSRAVSAARTVSYSVRSALNAGAGAAYSAGAYIGQGFANGMLSTLGTVRSAANQMAAEAQRAVEAKAKIASPSKVFKKLGAYVGEGFALGIEGERALVRRVSDALVSIPSVSSASISSQAGTGDLAIAGVGDMTITVPLYINGIEFARATYGDYENEGIKRGKFSTAVKGGRT